MKKIGYAYARCADVGRADVGCADVRCANARCKDVKSQLLFEQKPMFRRFLEGHLMTTTTFFRRHVAFMCEPTLGDFPGLFGFTQVS